MKTRIHTRQNISSDSVLEFNSNWNISFPKKPKTLQYFITSKCNYRCKNCFFLKYLGSKDVPIKIYKNFVYDKLINEGLEKVNFLGGEPTLYEDLEKAIEFNHKLGLKTHIYTNGANLNKINFPIYDSKIRLSVLSYDSEKPITKIKTDLPLTIVYPLNKDNLKDVSKVIKYAEKLNVSEFVFSTIKKLKKEGDFFQEKQGCITDEEYIDFLNNFFINTYSKIPEFHINSRGIFDLGEGNTNCNFINKLVDEKEVNCPFDIDIDNISSEPVIFGNKCHKNDVCLLEKIVVKRN